MKILFLEDGYDAAKFGGRLEKKGYEVDCAADFITATEFLESNKKYDVAIIDLDMNKRFLPHHLKEIAKGQYGGWVFYQHILKESQPHLSNRTIILSALLPDFLNVTMPDDYVNVTLVDKRAHDYMDQVLAKLEEYKLIPQH
ncbi:MAG: response regulator [Firmicutes bacterium]|nr:response regulator [Bacillota bacterium]